jgi:N utilization substance protein A
MDNSTARQLARGGIKTKEDLADLAVDDLIEIAEMDEARARQLILAARAPWFESQS